MAECAPSLLIPERPLATQARIERMAAAVAALQTRDGAAPLQPRVGLVLGSGLNGLVNLIEPVAAIPYADIDGMPRTTAPGHTGRLLLGRLAGVEVALCEGRLHLYEGHAAADVVLPIYLLRALGASHLIVTNAAGALDSRFGPGEVMLIDDHINLTGSNPLVGPNDDALGLRFPDMSRAYCPRGRELAIGLGVSQGISLRRGVYAGVTGPSLETSAERRYFRTIGADAVGMSTVLEVIAANHCGLAVVGLSAITNMATGGVEQQPDTIEEVLANAARAGEVMQRLIPGLVPRLVA